MRVRILFFGLLKDLVGRSADELEIEAGSRVETVFSHYASQFPKLGEMAHSIAVARNQEFAAADTELTDGDEIAFMPPVSGGSAQEWIEAAEDEDGFYAVSEQVIDSAALARRLLDGADGAVITFEGVVRNNSGGRRTLHLDYECYAPLAVKKMREIGADILERRDVRAIGMIHRVGRLEIGEASVSIVVCSAHRRAAYEASLEAINRLKKLVPVWKKEHFADGEVWVEGDWEAGVPRPAAAPESARS